MSNAAEVIGSQRRDWDTLWIAHGGVLLRRLPSVAVLGAEFGGRMIYVSVPPGCDPQVMDGLFRACVAAGLCVAFPEVVIGASGVDVAHRDGSMWMTWARGLLSASGAVLVPDVPGAMVSATVWCDVVQAVSRNMPVFVLGDG